MCNSCQQAGKVTDLGSTVYSPDRFLVNKLLKPQRWDLVVFRSVEDPSLYYVKRLIGFPGEEVVIDEGSIWINGTKQTPPPEIARLTFTAAPESFGLDVPKFSTRLGDGEYFVIGDFSLRSADSRTQGPIPGNNIEGVAALIYWPPSRWHLFR
jgi:signal peptidase I